MKQTVQPGEGSPEQPQTEASRIAQVVICVLDDSWSTLAAEAAVLDRWLGAEIAALFGD